MEELGSIWDYQENVGELRQKLLYTSFELESLKMEATEEIRNSQKKVKNLLNLLKMAYTERDEARNQLRILMNKFLYSINDEILTPLPPLKSDSPLFMPTKANSSITESNSLSHNSPVDSFFDTVSSPDLSSINTEDSSKTSVVHQQFLIDPSLQIIEKILKAKPLPQKGKLLQSVIDAGPLLQTLLVAGPLPRWRNPPPLETIKIPPFSIKGSEIVNFDKNPLPNSSFSAEKQQSSSSYSDTYRGSSQMCSASILSFNCCSSSGSCLDIPASKRPRFQ